MRVMGGDSDLNRVQVSSWSTPKFGPNRGKFGEEIVANVTELRKSDPSGFESVRSLEKRRMEVARQGGGFLGDRPEDYDDLLREQEMKDRAFSALMRKYPGSISAEAEKGFWKKSDARKEELVMKKAVFEEYLRQERRREEARREWERREQEAARERRAEAEREWARRQESMRRGLPDEVPEPVKAESWMTQAKDWGNALNRKSVGAGEGGSKGKDNLTPEEGELFRKIVEDIPKQRVAGFRPESVFGAKDYEVMRGVKGSLGEKTDLGDGSTFARKDFIKGGLADRRKISSFDKRWLKKGTKVEMEHTSNPKVAREIAMDHMAEFGPSYYRELEKMEERLRRAHK